MRYMNRLRCLVAPPEVKMHDWTDSENVGKSVSCRRVRSRCSVAQVTDLVRALLLCSIQSSRG